MDSLRLDPAALQCIRERAAALAPEEACGLLLGPDTGHATCALTLVNRADDRRRAYLIDPEEYLCIDYNAGRQGMRVIGVWHSHPAGPAEPSATDVELAWPEWHYLIVGLGGDAGGTLRCWWAGPDGFNEERITA